MRRTALAVVALLGLLVVAGGAYAAKNKLVDRVELRAGDLIIVGSGGFRPETLPKKKFAPITAYGGGKLSTVSGELPPILDQINFEFDRNANVDTTGLPACTKGKLTATTVAGARKACGDSVVGTGFGHVIVKFPEQAPIPASSGVTLFNGPKKNGNDTVLAHAHLDVPAPTTFIVPIEIEKIHNGPYGYRIEVDFPLIAGGAGHIISGNVTTGKRWTYKGVKRSYISARCATGGLQAHGEFIFDGVELVGRFFRPCKVAN